MVHGRSDYARVERALRFIHARLDSQPTLAEVAAEVGLSEFHFQRLFRRWAGVSPKRFLQYLTLEQAKRLLQETRSLLETSAAVGLSGPGRLHELFLAIERMTPGEYKSGARGLSIHYGVEDTPLGPALFAALDLGLCGISFITEGGVAGARAELQRRWPGAKLVDDPEAIRTYANALRRRLHGDLDRSLSVVLEGPPFSSRSGKRCSAFRQDGWCRTPTWPSWLALPPPFGQWVRQ